MGAIDEDIDQIKQTIDGPLKEIKIKQKQNEILKYLLLRETGEMTRDDFCNFMRASIELDQLLTGDVTPIPKIFIDDDIDKEDPLDPTGGVGSFKSGYFNGVDAIGVNPAMYALFMLEGNPNTTPEMMQAAFAKFRYRTDNSILADVVMLAGHEFQHAKQHYISDLVRTAAKDNPKISEYTKQVIDALKKNNKNVLKFEDVDKACKIMAYKNTASTEDKYSGAFVEAVSENRPGIASGVSYGTYALQAHEIDARFAGVRFCERITESLTSSESFEELSSNLTQQQVEYMKKDVIRANASEILKLVRLTNNKTVFDQDVKDFGYENIGKYQKSLSHKEEIEYTTALDILRTLTYDEASKSWTDQQFVDNYADVIISASTADSKFDETFKSMPEQKQKKINESLRKKIFKSLSTADCHSYTYNNFSSAMELLSEKDKEKLFDIMLSKKMYVPLIDLAGGLVNSLTTASPGLLKNFSKLLGIVENNDVLKYIFSQTASPNLTNPDSLMMEMEFSHKKISPASRKRIKHIADQMASLKKSTEAISERSEDEKNALRKAAAKSIASTCGEKYFNSHTSCVPYNYEDMRAEIKEGKKKTQEANDAEEKSAPTEIQEEPAQKEDVKTEGPVVEPYATEIAAQDPFNNVGYDEISEYVPKPEKELDAGMEQRK